MLKSKAKRKKKSIGKLKQEAAKLLQKLRRMESADEDGIAECVTCNVKLFWQELQGGHFIERGKSLTLLDETNINCQCPGCNCFLMKKASGVLRYRRFMVDYYGEEHVVDLEQSSYHTKKWDRVELEDLTQEYKERIKEQEIRLGA